MEPTAAAGGLFDQVRARPSFWRVAGRLARRNPPGVVGIMLVFILVMMAALADVATSYPPNDLVGLSNQPPSAEHYLGTDTIGRDIFTRLLFGARVSLLVGFSAVSVGMTAGLFLGLLTGYLRGTLDLLVQRLVDTLEAFPGIVLALAIVAILGASVWNVVLAAGDWLPGAGHSRYAVRGASGTGAHLCGGGSRTGGVDAEGHAGTRAAQLAIALLRSGEHLCGACHHRGIIAELSWARALARRRRRGAECSRWRRNSISAPPSPWPSRPGWRITAAVMGFNLFSDAIRDVLDPKLRRR